MIKPQPLRKGDIIAIISPAGAIKQPELITESVKILSSWGLHPITAPHAFTRKGYYSGNAEERLEDMRAMLNNKDVKAILCSYGGYGCVHLLSYIADDIARNPKWIAGMSDCSILHAAAVSKGIMSLHSPQCHYLAQQYDKTGIEYFKKTLFGWQPHYTIKSHPLNRIGETTGMLVGGNLSVLTALIGTPFNIFHPGTILFIEDINEPMYKIERMLYTLKLSGILGSLAALIVGNFTKCKENQDFGGNIYQIIHRMIAEYDYPVCFNFPVGHTTECYPLIEGANVNIKIKPESVKLTFRF